MPTYKTLIFDLDGTLVDTVHDIALYANQIMRTHGLPEANLKEVTGAIGEGVGELFMKLAPAYVSDEGRREEAVSEFKRVYTETPVVHSIPFPGVEEMLKGSLSQVKKAVLTNKPHAVTVRILDELGLSEYFEVVIGEGGDFRRKPDPAGLYEICDRTDTRPERVILIGDSEIDQLTAENAGCAFAWVDYGYAKLERPAEQIYSAPSEWGDLVK